MAEKKYVRHAVGFVEIVRHISEIFPVIDQETWWEFGNLLELHFDELRTSFAFIFVCGNFLVLGSFSEQTCLGVLWIGVKLGWYGQGLVM